MIGQCVKVKKYEKTKKTSKFYLVPEPTGTTV